MKASTKKQHKRSISPRKAAPKPRRPGPRSNGDGIAVREALIKSAKPLFARRGLSGTSIRDIAKASGINSSMISYYFESKEGLYRECFREIAKIRLAQAQTILRAPENRLDFESRLGRMVESLYTLFLEDRDAGLIIIREYDRTQSPAQDVLRETFNKVNDVMVEFFRAGQRKGFVESDADPFYMAGIFFGALVSQMRMDHINNKTHGRSLMSLAERDLLKNHMIRLFSK